MAQLYIDADRAGAELCRRPGGLAFFVKEFWDVIVPNELKWTPHMDVLCNEIQRSDERVFLRLPKEHDLIINVPPGTTKTKIVSVLSTAWEFARMPSIKVFVGSYSDGAVSGIADEIRLVIKSPKYQRWFPETVIRREKDSLHNWKTTANGEFFAFTVGGTLTSKHADILKVDDPINPKEAVTDAGLKTANEFMDLTLPMRKVDKAVTPTYLIMQRLAANDPTGHLLEKKKGHGIRHICLPGVAAGNVKPAEYESIYKPVILDPDHPLAQKYKSERLLILDLTRNGVQVLSDSLIDLGTYGYAGQIDQAPAPPGGVIWQKWFIEIPDEDFPEARWGTDHGTDWDLAYTKDDENAASAYFTTFKYKKRIYIDDFDFAWKEFPELIKWMKRQVAPHYIEAKASGKSAKQTLSQQDVIAIEVPVKGGADKKARARMATPIAEAGMVCIRKSLADRLYNDMKQGILQFPKGPFADVADALAQALQRHSSGGVRVMGEDQEFDELEELDY